MTREDILQSISLKKRFCKDNNLPISVYDNPYFYQRLEIINSVIPCVDSFGQFCKELEKFKCEQDYFEYYNSVKDNAINYLKGNVGYLKFNERTVHVPQPYISKRNLYIEENDGKRFISLDMKKANFSALHYYDTSIFGDAATWEEFISRFTDSSHIINSKYVRQVIMGACNPKRQITQEKLMMNVLLNDVVTQLKMAQADEKCSDIEAMLTSLNDFEMYSLGEDEIIIKIIGGNTLDNYLQMIKDIVKTTEYCDFIRVTAFELNKIPGTDGWIKKERLANIGNISLDYTHKGTIIKSGKYLLEQEYALYGFEFKCLSAEIYHQIIKYWNGQEPTEDDLVFYHNGCLARFLEPIENPWK